MKRHLTYILAAILAVVSFGCSDDVEQIRDVELTIRLTMASHMDTRTPRPLEGVDAWQHVTAVRVYVFRSDEENGTYTIYQPKYYYDGEPNTLHYVDVEEFKQKTGLYKEPDPETHTVVINPNLPDGYYRLLAIGVDEDTTLFDVITEDSKWDDIVKTFENGPITEEFFSGYSETVHITSSNDKDFIEIELKRCVAGVLLYVTKYEGTDSDSIKLILSGHSKTIDLINRRWNIDADPDETELIKYEAGAFNEEITVEKEDGTEEKKYRYYAGRFLLPSNTHNLTEPTLKLVFFKNGKEVKRKKVVLINASDDDYESSDLHVDKEGTHYNLVANRIYCIGFRSETGEIYQPIDLNEESDEVKIISYGSWQDDVDITL